MEISRQDARLVTMRGRFFAQNSPQSPPADQPDSRRAWLAFLGKRALPVLVSAGLVAWLVWTVQPERLADAAGALDWPWLTSLTAVLVLSLYLWDTVCLRWLFTEPGHPPRFWATLDARGRSYLFSAFNYELGQGVLAWRLSRAQQTTLASALARCVLLAYHDLVVLLSLGLVGALLTGPRARGVVQFCAAGVAVLLLLATIVALFSGRWRRRLANARWDLWPSSWHWRHSGQLLLLRYGYYGLIMLYAIIGLRHCGLSVATTELCGAVPCALLADGLPISVSGLGTREATLRYLLDPPDAALLVAFSLMWSTGLIFGRLSIGLVHWLAAPLVRSIEGNA
jgi:Lysylphosphatidylglycerol synthase TM region